MEFMKEEIEDLKEWSNDARQILLQEFGVFGRLSRAEIRDALLEKLLLIHGPRKELVYRTDNPDIKIFQPETGHVGFYVKVKSRSVYYVADPATLLLPDKKEVTLHATLESMRTNIREFCYPFNEGDSTQESLDLSENVLGVFEYNEYKPDGTYKHIVDLVLPDETFDTTEVYERKCEPYEPLKATIKIQRTENGARVSVEYEVKDEK